MIADFCGGCGQRTPKESDYLVRTFLRAAVGQLTNYDSRLLGTVRALFVRPGQLARDHFDGRRARHLDPVRIFVLSNVLAWFIVPYTHMFGFSLQAGLRFSLFAPFWSRALAARAQLSGVSVEQLAQRIDAISRSENPVAVVCLVPLLCLGLSVVLAGRRYRVVHHLVFAAHFYCIHLCCVLLYLGFLLAPLAALLNAHPRTAPLAGLLRNLWVEHLALAPVLIAYAYFAMQRAYALTPRESSWRAVAIGLWACTVSRAFFDVGFALVLLFA